MPQLWYILFYTMKDIVILIQEGKYIRPHIYNMMSGSIRRNVDRRLANKKEIRPWERLRPEKEPIVTGVLFDNVFGKGDIAFKTVTASNAPTYFTRPDGACQA